jgi:hypothetical protein
MRSEAAKFLPRWVADCSAHISVEVFRARTQSARESDGRQLNGTANSFLPVADYKDTWSSRAPVWSPNGQYIYFTGARGAATEQIFVMDADGGHQTPLTTAGANAEATVRYVRPPAITSITATPNVLWPPNNRMTRVSVDVAVSDTSDPMPACRIVDVTSNESTSGSAWHLEGPPTLSVAADRHGSGSGRTYTLSVTCTNTSELSSTAMVTVNVPHDRGR